MKQHDLVRMVMTRDDHLDDITRARIWSRLDDRLNEAPPARARWPIMLGVAAIAAAGVLVMVRMGHDTTDGNARVIAVPADTTVTSNLGPYTRAALVGATELEILGTPGMATSIRLRHGMLLADFEGGPGRSLRVEAPDAIVEIVGTLFAVEARGSGSCTSVVHGRVRVTTSSSSVFVGAGQRYCTGSAEPQPIDASMKDALERHGTVITAQVEASQSPVVAVPEAPRLEVSAPPPSSVPAAPPDPNVPPPSVARAAAAEPVAPRVASAPPPNSAPAGDASPEPRVASVPPPSSVPTPALAPEPVAPRVASAPPPSSVPRAPSPEAPVPPPAAPRVHPSAPSPVASAEPVAPRIVPSPPAPASPPTADDLYRAAETALGAGALARADQALDRLITEFPSSSLVDQALYERARIAYQQRAWATARRHLDRLATLPRTTLAEPGHYLTCRIAVETRDGGAVSCLVDYRRAFPRSPHDLEALALVVKLTHASSGCGGVAGEINELVASHPKSRHAASWRARCPERR